MHGAWKQWGRPVHQCAPSSVEHGITEMVHGCVDIVEMQMRLQIPGLAPEGGVSQILKTLGGIETTGHAIEVVEAAVLTTPVAGLPSFVRPQCNGNDVVLPHYDSLLAKLMVMQQLLAFGMHISPHYDSLLAKLMVSPHYDSLLAKLMVWAPTRQEAVQKMAVALQATKLQGTPNNLQLLKVRGSGTAVLVASRRGGRARALKARNGTGLLQSMLPGFAAVQHITYQPGISAIVKTQACREDYGVPSLVAPCAIQEAHFAAFLLTTNAVVDDSRFKAGDTTTKFLQGLNFQPRLDALVRPTKAHPCNTLP
eukprot:1014304-Pelagomonas_calceolata.AAC.4